MIKIINQIKCLDEGLIQVVYLNKRNTCEDLFECIIDNLFSELEIEIGFEFVKIGWPFFFMHREAKVCVCARGKGLVLSRN